MTGVTIDITTRKKSEEVQSTLAAIVESSADAIVSKDLNSTITSWNSGAERLFGYTAAETIGQPISILIPDDRLNEEPDILKRIRRGERIEHYETIRRRKDGTLLDISLTVSPIFDARGRIVGASKIARDISARKRTEAELKTLITREREARAEAETANRVKDEFLAMVSHELRTPLNAIRGWTQLLKSGKLDQPQTERAIETIDRNAKAQVTIINELLDVAGIISGKLKLEMKPIYLAEVLSASLDVVRPAAAAKAIELVAVLDQTAGPVAAEPVRLQQVFWNLLTNAIKFTPKRGRIEVQLERAGSSVVVVVRDNGPGIPASFLPLIFDRFQQADTSARRAHGGLGLGLSIARNLVEMHGGTIRAESDGENRGASFTVTLPIIAIMGLTNDGLEYSDAVSASPTHEAVQQRVAVPQDGDLRSDSLRGVKVLAVDDQSETHDLIILALTRYGAEVRASTSVSAALKMIQDWQPDVLVSDIGMPGEDGYDLIRKIRALDPKNGGRIPALALTGYASPADESRARAAGYQTHMSKPVELRKLAERIVQLSGR
jgi:PAS domain S-box-containing protein